MLFGPATGGRTEQTLAAHHHVRTVDVQLLAGALLGADRRRRRLGKRLAECVEASTTTYAAADAAPAAAAAAGIRERRHSQMGRWVDGY